MMKAKDHTPQEQKIASCLDELGLRYAEQYPIGRFFVDFFISPDGIVIEADGIHGHFQKSDAKRDAVLIQHDEVTRIHHIKAQSRTGIMSALISLFSEEHQWEE